MCVCAFVCCVGPTHAHTRTTQVWRRRRGRGRRRKASSSPTPRRAAARSGVRGTSDHAVRGGAAAEGGSAGRQRRAGTALSSHTATEVARAPPAGQEATKVRDRKPAPHPRWPHTSPTRSRGAGGAGAAQAGAEGDRRDATHGAHAPHEPPPPPAHIHAPFDAQKARAATGRKPAPRSTAQPVTRGRARLTPRLGES